MVAPPREIVVLQEEVKLPTVKQVGILVKPSTTVNIMPVNPSHNACLWDAYTNNK